MQTTFLISGIITTNRNYFYIFELCHKVYLYIYFMQALFHCNKVLRPVSSINCLEVWQYYVSEELSHGAPYDLEVLTPTTPDLSETQQRRLVTAG